MKVFGLFFALLVVCALRGASLHAWAWWRTSHESPIALPGKPRPAPLPLPER